MRRYTARLLGIMVTQQEKRVVLVERVPPDNVFRASSHLAFLREPRGVQSRGTVIHDRRSVLLLDFPDAPLALHQRIYGLWILAQDLARSHYQEDTDDNDERHCKGDFARLLFYSCMATSAT